jgi:hypothetical protein
MANKTMKKIEVEDWNNVLKWSYNLARKFAVENLVPQGVTSARKFDAYKRSKKPLPKKFPRIPDEYFIRKGTWKGWRDFLGYPDQKKSRNFLRHKDASRVARNSNIKNSKEYLSWKERPSNMPARPEYFYEEWKGWRDFLGEKFQKPNPRHYTKLSEADVRIIKHQLRMGVSGALLARTFKVSEMQISRIKRGENWNEI